MAYLYEVSFDIRPEQMEELRIGASLERVLGYLKALLPEQSGYITARAVYSVDGADKTHIIVQSEWETWADLDAHCQSSLSEDKVLKEFEPHVAVGDLVTRAYTEVP
jgi:quinol monooxygenase YgiN